MFYQHFPYAPHCGRMHWRHAVSDDLTNREHLSTYQKGGLGKMWECLDYFKIGDRGVIVFSPMETDTGNQTLCALSTPNLGIGADIEVYVDSNIIKVYINGGEYVITHAVYGLTDEISSDTEYELLLCAFPYILLKTVDGNFDITLLSKSQSLIK